MNKIEVILSRLLENNPNPKIELNFSDEYTLLVAVMLSAQTTDKRVNLVTAKLFPLANTPKQMLDLGEEKIKSIIKSIGLYKTKAKNLVLLSKSLVEEFNSKVPNNISDLTKLAGVGIKTAKVVLADGFNLPYIGVDTHVLRVSHRLELSSAKTPNEMSEELEALTPKKLRHLANSLLVLHGRYVCKAKSPSCNECCLKDLCPSFKTCNKT